MGDQVMGTYEGETLAVPDVANASTTVANSGKGRTTAVSVDRRRRMRVSSEGARSAVALTGSAQTFTNANGLAIATRGIYVSAGGSITGRFADDSADVTLSALTAGQVYPFALISITSVAGGLTGVALF